MKEVIHIFNYQVVKNSATKKGTIFIDGDIVDEPTREMMAQWWGDETSVSYKSLRDELTGSEVKDWDVYVNSMGGHVGDALAMHDLIQDLNKKGYSIDTHVRGMAASASTYVAMAGRKGGRTVSQNSSMLIHNVSGGIRGNVNEIENYAKAMRKFNDCIVDFYTNKTGLSKTVISNMMDAETWMIGQDIVDQGFMDNCDGKDATFKNAINEQVFPFKNKAILNKYNSFVNKSSSENTTGMKLKNLGQTIMDALKSAGIINADNSDAPVNVKPADLSAAIENAVNKVFEGVDSEIENVVKTAMENTLKANATKSITDMLASDGFKNALTEATKNLTTKEEHEKLVTELTNKLAGMKTGNKATESANNGGDKLEGEIWS